MHLSVSVNDSSSDNSHDAQHGDGHGAHPHGPSPTQRLFLLLRGEARDLWVVLTYAVGVGLLSLVVPIATASLVNTVSFGTVVQPLVVLTFLVLVGLSFEGLMRALQFWVVEVLQRRIFVKVALDLARRLPRVHATAFDRASGPELVNRFFEVLTVQKTAATLLLDGLAVLLQALIGTLLLAFYHPILLAFDAVLVAGMFVILVPLGRGAIDTSVQESKAKYAVAAWLEEIARLTHAFRGGAPADFAERRVDQLSQRYLSARAAHFAIVFRQHVGSLTFKAVLSAALLGVGGWLVIQRGLTIGQLAAAELVVTAVVAGMAKFAKQLESWYDLVTAADKLGHLTDLPLERTDGHEVPDASTRGVRLELRAVSFSHDGRSDALRDVSLAVGARRARRGARTLGQRQEHAHGAHHRTPRRPVGQRVHRGRRPERALARRRARRRGRGARRRDLRRHRGRERRRGTSQRDARARARGARGAAPRRRAVAALSEGVNTVLSTRGSPLSATQAHALMFARAIAVEPRLIVVDGALDGLDAEVVRDVMAALTAPGAPWTLLVLTHRDEIAAMCAVVHRLDGATLPRAAARWRLTWRLSTSPYRAAAMAPSALAMVRTPRAARVLAQVFAALFVTFVVCLFALPWQQTSTGSGRVVAYAPVERQQVIDAPIEGRVVRFAVREGMHVRQGDLLVEITDNDPQIMQRLRQERDAVVARLEAARARAESIGSRAERLTQSRTNATEAASQRVRHGHAAGARGRARGAGRRGRGGDGAAQRRAAARPWGSRGSRRRARWSSPSSITSARAPRSTARGPRTARPRGARSSPCDRTSRALGPTASRPSTTRAPTAPRRSPRWPLRPRSSRASRCGSRDSRRSG